jgi:hypothetical protein
MDVAHRGWKSGLVNTAMIHRDLGAEPAERRYDVRPYEIGAADDEHSHARSLWLTGPTSL